MLVIGLIKMIKKIFTLTEFPGLSLEDDVGDPISDFLRIVLD